MYYAALFLLLLHVVNSNHSEVQFSNKKHTMHHFHFWVQKQEKKNW